LECVVTLLVRLQDSLLALGTTVLFSCTPPGPPKLPAALPDALQVNMPGTDGQSHSLAELVKLHDWTVVLFYSDTCPTVKAHDPRINTLTERYAPKRVGFYWVDSEAGANVTRDASSAATRGYSMPILIDAGAQVADALGARYASQAFILSHNGNLVYSGGIDSDKRFLHPDATPYLASALDAVLADATPPASDVRALGCALAR
jgi:Redoxin